MCHSRTADRSMPIAVVEHAGANSDSLSEFVDCAVLLG
jgi:hypothetical protein